MNYGMTCVLRCTCLFFNLTRILFLLVLLFLFYSRFRNFGIPCSSLVILFSNKQHISFGHCYLRKYCWNLFRFFVYFSRLRTCPNYYLWYDVKTKRFTNCNFKRTFPVFCGDSGQFFNSVIFLSLSFGFLFTDTCRDLACQPNRSSESLN